MTRSLIRLDEAGCQISFGAYFSCFPFSLLGDGDKPGQESLYHALPVSAMQLADADFVVEGAVGDGRCDGCFRAPDGNSVFIIELKYCPGEKDKEKKFLYDELAQKMDEMADIALRQIDEKRYAKPYWRTGVSVYKVALVVGARTEVRVVIQKEDDDKIGG